MTPHQCLWGAVGPGAGHTPVPLPPCLGIWLCHVTTKQSLKASLALLTGWLQACRALALSRAALAVLESQISYFAWFWGFWGEIFGSPTADTAQERRKMFLVLDRIISGFAFSRKLSFLS